MLLNNLVYSYKNGYHIVLFTLYIFYLKQYYLGCIFFLKLFSANFYYNFSYKYPIPIVYKWKHMIRLTDTGHIGAILVYYDKSWVPITFNVTFIITFVYWISLYMFNMSDVDDVNSKEINIQLQKIHCTINHGCYLLWMMYYIMKNNYEFNNTTLIMSFGWIISWFLFIYIPWRIYTGDVVYSTMKSKKHFILTLFLCLFVLKISNTIGYEISRYHHYIPLN